MLSAKDRLIVALDVDSQVEAERLVELLYDQVGMFKVGMQLFNSEGPAILEVVKRLGGRIFADLKFHDIPNTVAQAGKVMTRHGVHMYNVHVAGGREMMEETVKVTRQEAERLGIPRPLVIGVTVLTSISQEQLSREIGIERNLTEQVVAWARLAQEAGLDGVVASPQEIASIRAACGPDFLIVTPGVRPRGTALNDQKRVMTPGEAVKAGASYLVIGRPITGAANPRQAAKDILTEMEESAC
ncbi:MAG: orotidine-5'-phosphate decarboxylase [Firmicutes bacterium]|nr:orotidine-5'-phosphate decarboxylase [Bacillota bacterium]